MKRRYLILSMILCLMFVTVSAFGMECETPPFVTQTVEPNILIIFDNSGSMATEVWIDSYDRSVDHSEGRLPADEDQIIFAKDVDCYIDHNRVSYDSSTGKVRLKYKKAVPDSTNICSGGDDSSYYTQWSDIDGYFYFDREEGVFINKSEYEGDDGEIKIFLPYATYSVDPPSSTGSYTTWYDYDYMNWLFYDSTQADRDALKLQHDDPEPARPADTDPRGQESGEGSRGDHRRYPLRLHGVRRLQWRDPFRARERGQATRTGCHR